MAVDLSKYLKGRSLAPKDFNFNDADNHVEVKTDAASSVGAAIGAAIAAATTPDATDTVKGKTSLAVAANYPSTSDAEAVTPAYLSSAIAAATPDTSATTRGLVNLSSMQQLGAGDKVINGVRVGRGAGDVSTNTAVGSGALNSNTTGSANTANGYAALISNTTGSGNIAVGSITSTGAYSPAFDITTQDNRISMGSTAVTNAYIQVAWTVVSDARDKTEFADVPHGLDFVSKLKPVAYRFKESRDSDVATGPVRYGFKAQDVLALEGDKPVIVDADDAEKLRFNDTSLIPVLVKAIQELKAEIETLKAK
jgi:hypothetical protein